MVFTNVINPRAFLERKHEYKKTVVKKGTSIGANATIVCGTTLGEYSFVGAGSVVTKDIGPYWLVYGNPARQRGFICYCGLKLIFDNNEAICSCGKKYRQISQKEISLIT
jgi:UDP-2-acetamido-3-amino-2,3-dideoxy-glucuronate N-acetyltransferase